MKKLLIYKKIAWNHKLVGWKNSCTKKFPSMVNNIGPSLVAMEP